VEAESEESAVTAITDLETPAVTVHLDVMEDNIRRVQAHLARHGLGNRPHIKTHKIPAIGRMQMAAGAVGITCQKLGEVEVFADAKVADDVLLTYNILGAAKTERLMALARRVPRLAVVLDNETVARDLSAGAAAHRVDLEFLVECDTGFRRTGVQTPEEALALARAAMKLPGLRFKGLMTFPNRDPDTREFFERALALFERAGIPVPVVSGGGTPALATVDRFPMLTEHRAGTCVYNDAMVVSTGTATWEQCAMRVRATVVSRPTDDRGVLDAGSKVLTSDLYHMKGYGHLMEYPEAQVAHLSEEHAVVDFAGCAERPKVGEVVSVVPNHCCVVTNMVDEIYGVRGGAVEVVWPVAARGRVR
jgi:D-serine deaminase-like pyridoxal phosphate-dependent protein